MIMNEVDVMALRRPVAIMITAAEARALVLAVVEYESSMIDNLNPERDRTHSYLTRVLGKITYAAKDPN